MRTSRTKAPDDSSAILIDEHSQQLTLGEIGKRGDPDQPSNLSGGVGNRKSRETSTVVPSTTSDDPIQPTIASAFRRSHVPLRTGGRITVPIAGWLTAGGLPGMARRVQAQPEPSRLPGAEAGTESRPHLRVGRPVDRSATGRYSARVMLERDRHLRRGAEPLRRMFSNPDPRVQPVCPCTHPRGTHTSGLSGDWVDGKHTRASHEWVRRASGRMPLLGTRGRLLGFPAYALSLARVSRRSAIAERSPSWPFGSEDRPSLVAANPSVAAPQPEGHSSPRQKLRGPRGSGAGHAHAAYLARPSASYASLRPATTHADPRIIHKAS